MPAFIATVLSVLFAMVMLGSSPAHGEGAQRAVPISGVVLNTNHIPVANAHVVLIRHAGQERPSLRHEILAQGTTDAAGKFSFGPVVLDTEVEFPRETQVSWEFAVETKDVMRMVRHVAFTA